MHMDILKTNHGIFNVTVTHWPNSDSSRCQIGIIGVSDGTKVEITFPSHTNRGIIQVEYDSQVYGSGDTLTVVMNRYSTLQLQSKGELTTGRSIEESGIKPFIYYPFSCQWQCYGILLIAVSRFLLFCFKPVAVCASPVVKTLTQAAVILCMLTYT